MNAFSYLQCRRRQRDFRIYIRSLFHLVNLISDMPQCCVYGCYNASGKDKYDGDNIISYHTLPTTNPLRKSWITCINRKDWNPSNSTVVCSIHFHIDDFELDLYSQIMNEPPRRRRLKPNAVPSLFLRGEERHRPTPSTSRDSTYLSKRRKVEEDESIQRLLCTNNDIVQSNNVMNPSSIGVQFCPDTKDRKTEARPSATNFSSQFQPRVKDVSTQIDFVCCNCAPSIADNSTTEEDEISEDEYLPSNNPSTDCDSDTDSSDPDSIPDSITAVNVFLCFVESIKVLLKFCPKCGSAVENHRINFEGSMLRAKLICLNGCKVSWCSQPTLGAKSFRSGIGDFQLAVSLVICGGTYALLKSVADCFQMGIFSSSFFYDVQRHYLAPVIFSAWNSQQEVILQELAEKPSVRVAGDSRCDSPGFTAKYSTYTMMDIDSGYILCGRLVQLGQEASSSVQMEKVGFNSCINFLLDRNIDISVIATDRCPSIIKEIRDNYPEINHQHDVWHIAKSVKKSLLAASKTKSTSILNEWLRSIVNHLYYSTQHCDGDPDRLVELWLSELNHICGNHSWDENTTFRQVFQCSHENVDETLANRDLEKSYLQFGSDAYLALKNIVSAPRLLSALRHCTLSLSTASLENLHSVMLKYTPKRLHFGSLGMNYRTILAYLDHNNNIERDQKNWYKYQYSKISGRWVARRVYADKKYSWRKDLLKDAMDLRISGVSPPNCEAPFSNISFPRNIAPVHMPSKTELRESLIENSRHIV